MHRNLLCLLFSLLGQLERDSCQLLLCLSPSHTLGGAHEKSRGTKTSVFSNHTDKLEKWVAFWLGLFLNVANSFPKTSVFSNCTDKQKKLLTVI